jgi:deoxyribose-phosphate aldolase
MNLAKYIDHTFLKASGGADDVRKLCREAKKYSFHSVCVNPAEVKLAKKLLKNTDVRICTVIDFPLGQSTTAVKCAQAADAIAMGADELDFVMNIRLLKYDPESCAEELKSVCRSAVDARRPITRKLIIECCYLTDEEKILACKLAKAAGFEFVKTSTGFGTGGATVKDVKLMRRAVGKKMGVKAAGSIRTKEDALSMIAAGADRLGCSASVEIVG